MIGLSPFYTYVLCLVLGFNVGVLGGFFGVGGAFLLTPALHILGVPMANAVATGLAFSIGVSVWGGYKHYCAGNVSTRIVLYAGVISLIGLSISQPLVIYLEQLDMADYYIRIAYILLLLSFGIMTFKREGGGHSPFTTYMERIKNMPPLIQVVEGDRVSLWVIVVISLFVGFLKGFMGVGGGFLLVPLFILVLKMEPCKAAGTSLLVLILSSIYGTLLYIFSGSVLFDILAFLVIGSFLGVNMGVRATQRIDAGMHKRFYGLFLLLVFFGVLAKHLAWETVSLYYTMALTLGVVGIIIVKYYLKFSGLKDKP